jgi:tetratricopeptide (TPR) repeat protein
MSVGWQRYVLTLPARWADMLNALLLAAGVPMSLLAAILILPAARRTGTSPLLLFGMVVFVSSAVLLVFGNSFLGLARDWDLASIPATAMAFLTLAFLATPEKGLRLAYRRVFPAALIAALCSFVLWQQVNADEDASASRFSDIVAMDSGLLLPMNTYTARENLRKFYRAEGLTPAYFSVLQQMAETGYHKPATYSEYLSSALQLQDTRAREEHITWLLGRLEAEASSTFPADDYRRIDERTLRELSTRVLLTLAQTGEQSRVDEWTKRLQPRLDPWPELLLVQIVNGDYTGALPVTEAAAAAVDSATTDPFLIMTVGGICEQHGAYARAASWYRRALRMEPKTYPSWYLVAARLYADRLGDIAAAKDVLEQCIRAVPDTREAASARDILSRLP